LQIRLENRINETALMPFTPWINFKKSCYISL